MRILSIILSCWLPVMLHAATDTPDRTVAYKKVAELELKLHIFEPENYKPSDHRPAIIFFFGGGWVTGDAKQFFQQCRDLAGQGMLAISADYRVKKHDNATPFECVKDGKSAVRWVRKHAAELGVDPNKIVVAGGSAGGHIAACTGIIEGCEEAGDDLTVSSIPNAMVLFNPVLDTTEKGYGAKHFKPEQQTEISPNHHVRKGLVPAIVFHGTMDKTVPFENAEHFTRLMKEAGNHSELASFEGKDHGFFNGSWFNRRSNNADYNLIMKDMIRFLEANGILDAR